MTSQRVVVVGAGLAGLRAAEGLRRGGFLGEVVVVGAEPYPPYNRPPVSKEVLTAGADLPDLELPRPADVAWRLGRSAVAADLRGRTVRLDDGTVLGWDGLVVASGVRPRRLPVPGPTAGRYVLRGLADGRALRAALQPGVRVVVVGAGFVGCEVARAARDRGCRVVCTAADPEPMWHPLGPELGAVVRRRHQAAGVRFRLGEPVRAVLGTDRAVGVFLADGTTLAGDLVVEAIGSEPATEWLAGTDADRSDGVVTDALLRVLRPDGSPIDGVVAAGDVARVPVPLAGPEPRRVEHWSMPTVTGRRAGAVLAAWLGRGADPAGWTRAVAQPFDPVPSFWSDQGDVRLQSFGAPEAGPVRRVLAGQLPGVAGPGEVAGPGGVAGVAGVDAADGVVVGYARPDGLLVGVVGLGRLDEVLHWRGHLGRPG